MTGTSLDGLDAALVEIDGSGLAMRARFERGVSRELGACGEGLRRLAEQTPMKAGEIAALLREFSLLHLEAVRELLRGEACDLVCVHGQTVFHGPPASWQAFQAWPLARGLGVPVVFDLRQADLAAGGQGAPITPIADWVLFSKAMSYGGAGIINLGGFCNVTLFDQISGPESIRARDVCACNQLLDEIARRLLRVPFDYRGARAMSGTIHEEALDALDGVLRAQAASRRSLGTGDELVEWIERFRARVSPEDLAKTACEGIGHVIVLACGERHRLVLAGGGAKNEALVRAIEASSTAKVIVSNELGVPTDMREAACFAVLGALCQDRMPITLPGVTGCAGPAPVAGVWVMP